MRWFPNVLISCVCLFFAVQYSAAQSAVVEDKELARLVDVVKMLRNADEANFNKAQEVLKADQLWVAMSETGGLQETECKPSEKMPTFKLNRILYAAEKARKYVSAKSEMLNGEDSRYDYSLFERSLKKGKSATYRLKKRVGKQTFVLIPYVKKKGSLSVMIAGKKPATVECEDGTVVCTFNATGKELAMTVTNKSGAALPFVILNHNSRKK